MVYLDTLVIDITPETSPAKPATSTPKKNSPLSRQYT